MELSSMMRGNRLAVGHDPSRHAAYAGHWIKVLRDDPREIYRAAQDARETSDYVLGRRYERESEHEGDQAPQRARDPGHSETREDSRGTAGPPPFVSRGRTSSTACFRGRGRARGDRRCNRRTVGLKG